MKTELVEIKIGNEFFVFLTEADAMAAAGAMMRGGRTISSGRGISIEPVKFEMGRKHLDVSKASVQRLLGR